LSAQPIRLGGKGDSGGCKNSKKTNGVEEMKITVIKEALNGVLVLQPEVFEDARGFFLEAYRADLFKELGIDLPFVQDNHSGSVKNVVRGLHFQWHPPMAKLMRVTRGEAFLVAVDIRKGSPTLGQWIGEVVSAANRKQIWAPAGFARGFCVLSDYAEIQYKCTGIYNKNGESGILWNDPQIGIKWPVSAQESILSEKDARAQTLAEWLGRRESEHFKF
jgi:dTDP-4-dehydrorhamnose 3,5-epimerase